MNQSEEGIRRGKLRLNHPPKPISRVLSGDCGLPFIPDLLQPWGLWASPEVTPCLTSNLTLCYVNLSVSLSNLSVCYYQYYLFPRISLAFSDWFRLLSHSLITHRSQALQSVPLLSFISLRSMYISQLGVVVLVTVISRIISFSFFTVRYLLIMH